MGSHFIPLRPGRRAPEAVGQDVVGVTGTRRDPIVGTELGQKVFRDSHRTGAHVQHDSPRRTARHLLVQINHGMG